MYQQIFKTYLIITERRTVLLCMTGLEKDRLIWW